MLSGLHPACRDTRFHNVPPHHLQREAPLHGLPPGGLPGLRNKRCEQPQRQDTFSKTKGSGCPPPHFVSRPILLHGRNPCQAGSGLRLHPVAGRRERRAATPSELRGARRIQVSSCGDHPLVRTHQDPETAYCAAMGAPGAGSEPARTSVRNPRHAVDRPAAARRCFGLFMAIVRGYTGPLRRRGSPCGRARPKRST